MESNLRPMFPWRNNSRKQLKVWMRLHHLMHLSIQPWTARVSCSIKPHSVFTPCCARSFARSQQNALLVEIGNYPRMMKMWKWLMSLRKQQIWMKMLLILVNKLQMSSIVLSAKYSPCISKPKNYKNKMKKQRKRRSKRLATSQLPPSHSKTINNLRTLTANLPLKLKKQTNWKLTSPICKRNFLSLRASQILQPLKMAPPCLLPLVSLPSSSGLKTRSSVSSSGMNLELRLISKSLKNFSLNKNSWPLWILLMPAPAISVGKICNLWKILQQKQLFLITNPRMCRWILFPKMVSLLKKTKLACNKQEIQMSQGILA